jgi:glucoamylase
VGVTEKGGDAFGGPGLAARWTSSAKTGVGTSLSRASRVWFTLSHGILNEIYFPRIDQACTRDMGLIVTQGDSFFSEEKRHTRSVVSPIGEGIPAYELVNTCLQGYYRMEKTVLTDPMRDVLLQRTRFVPLRGSLRDFRVYVLLAPHLGNRGAGNTGWTGDYKGKPMLFAARAGFALALACSAPWIKRSAGFVGASDGWQDLQAHKQMTWEFERAANGNVALAGEIDVQSSPDGFLLSLGFGENSQEAGNQALAGLVDGFDQAKEASLKEWQDWQKCILSRKGSRPSSLCLMSSAVLRVHEAKAFPGGTIASLSIPWGSSKGDGDLGGYHLVWPRDLVETATGFLALGAMEDARRVLRYLATTQEEDGHWAQNMWLDGTPYWHGIQMDETAFPVLLVNLALREKALGPGDSEVFWPMVRKAAQFLVKNGPVTPQDRWEEDAGFSPFTLSVEIAALLAAAELAEGRGEKKAAAYLVETADVWASNIDRWTYVTGTELAGRLNVEGYYVRIAPVETAEAASPAGGFVPIKNRPPGWSSEPAARIVSPDALALVRFGLRAADDPRITNTVKVIDGLLKVDTPNGPSWHRYNGDGYGEHEDGSPFDGTGVGRAWPLLTGERGHYELAAGRKRAAGRLLKAMEAFARATGLLPEQVWDSADIPPRELFFGRPSGSAMPLVWAHSEYIKLARSLRDGQVFDTPRQTVKRYIVEKRKSARAVWRFNHKLRSLDSGFVLRVEVLSPARLRWSADGWRTAEEVETIDSGLGVHYADLPTGKLPRGTVIVFTFYWTGSGKWEGTDYSITVVGTGGR